MLKRNFIKVVLVIGLGLLSIQGSAQLSGIYNISDTSVFKTINSAVDSIVEAGINGPVIFELDSGYYNEAVIIPEIQGASAVNTITFRAKDRRRADVKITSNVSQVFHFNGADYIILKALTILTTVGKCIEISNGANYITIDSCDFKGANNLNRSRQRDIISNSELSIDNYTTIKNSNFQFGSISIIIRGISVNQLETGHIIENNTVSKSTTPDNDIYVSNSKNCVVRGNIINATDGATGGQASIIMVTSYNSVVSGNKIISNKCGIRIASNYLGNFQDSTMVFNNMVTCKSANTSNYAFYMNGGCKNVFIYNNSFHMDNSQSYCAALYVRNDGSYRNIEFINNNITSKAGSIAYLDVDTSCFVFDYNNCFSAGNYYIARVNQYWYITFEDLLKSGFVGEHNISEDPMYVSVNDLHATNPAIGNNGIPVARVITDFDNIPRNQTQPDIGANEFDPENHRDLQLSKLYFNSIPHCSTPENVMLVIRNIGIDTIKSFGIERTINHRVKDTINWSGNLVSYGQIQYSLNYSDFEDGDTLMITLIKPNNADDENALNNSIATEGIWLAHKGDYIVGTESQDMSLKEVIEDINKRGICGNVSIRIKNGTYNSSIVLENIAGASEQSKILIESISGNPADVIIAPSKTNVKDAVVEITGTDYVTVKNLTVNADTIDADGVSFSNGATNNLFENLIVYANAVGKGAGFNSYNGDDNNTTIRGCTIYNGSYGIYAEGNRKEDNIVIEQNKISGSIVHAAIYASIVNNIKIRGNTITIDSSFTADGIEVYDVYGDLEITNNFVKIDSTTSYGLDIEYFYDDTFNYSVIANNVVHVGGKPNAGIYFYEITNTKLYNNTIIVESDYADTYVLYLDYFSAVDIKNNNLIAYRNTTPLRLGSRPIGLIDMDYNNIYYQGILFANDNGISIPDFNKWLQTGWDSHSVSTDPAFDENYHSCNNLLNNSGAEANGIPEKDIYGRIRNRVTPDIGAVELRKSTNSDLGEDIVLCDNSYVLDAGNDAVSYSWNTGETTQTISVNSPGVYTVSTIDYCNSINKDTIVVLSSEIEPSFKVLNSGGTVALINTSTGSADNFLWDYETGLSTMENVYVNFSNKGSYTISLTVSNECNTKTKETTINITSTDLKELNDSQVKVYPGIVTSVLKIDFNNVTFKSDNVNIIDVNGVLRKSVEINNLDLSNTTEIDMSDLNSGTYIVTIDQTRIGQFIKK